MEIQKSRNSSEIPDALPKTRRSGEVKTRLSTEMKSRSRPNSLTIASSGLLSPSRVSRSNSSASAGPLSPEGEKNSELQPALEEEREESEEKISGTEEKQTEAKPQQKEEKSSENKEKPKSPKKSDTSENTEAPEATETETTEEKKSPINSPDPTTTPELHLAGLGDLSSVDPTVTPKLSTSFSGISSTRLARSVSTDGGYTTTAEAAEIFQMPSWLMGTSSVPAPSSSPSPSPSVQIQAGPTSPTVSRAKEEFTKRASRRLSWDASKANAITHHVFSTSPKDREGKGKEGKKEEEKEGKKVKKDKEGKKDKKEEKEGKKDKKKDKEAKKDKKEEKEGKKDKKDPREEIENKEGTKEGSEGGSLKEESSSSLADPQPPAPTKKRGSRRVLNRSLSQPHLQKAKLVAGGNAAGVRLFHLGSNSPASSACSANITTASSPASMAVPTTSSPSPIPTTTPTISTPPTTPTVNTPIPTPTTPSASSPSPLKWSPSVSPGKLESSYGESKKSQRSRAHRNSVDISQLTSTSSPTSIHSTPSRERKDKSSHSNSRKERKKNRSSTDLVGGGRTLSSSANSSLQGGDSISQFQNEIKQERSGKEKSRERKDKEKGRSTSKKDKISTLHLSSESLSSKPARAGFQLDLNLVPPISTRDRALSCPGEKLSPTASHSPRSLGTPDFSSPKSRSLKRESSGSPHAARKLMKRMSSSVSAERKKEKRAEDQPLVEEPSEGEDKRPDLHSEQQG
jgi:hypothetical protein